MRWHPLCHCASSTAVKRKSFYSAVTTILADVRRRVERQLFAWLITTLTALACGGANAAPASNTKARFAIPSLTLADALDRFGEQSGFQIIYEHSDLDGRTAPQITGEMSAAHALSRLLAD